LTIIALLVAVGRVVPVIAGLLLFVAFLAWAIVGIVRSALAVVRSSAAPIRRKSYACAALSIMVVAVAKTAVDAVAFALLVRG